MRKHLVVGVSDSSEHCIRTEARTARTSGAKFASTELQAVQSACLNPSSTQTFWAETCLALRH